MSLFQPQNSVLTDPPPIVNKNAKGGRILLNIMEDIPYERVKGKQSHKNITGIFVEIKIRNKR